MHIFFLNFIFTNIVLVDVLDALCVNAQQFLYFSIKQKAKMMVPLISVASQIFSGS